jgi:hypothetical protein
VNATDVCPARTLTSLGLAPAAIHSATAVWRRSCGRSGGAVDHARSFAELVSEQRRHRNQPDGFWVASTDPTAAEHALADTAPRDGLQGAAVLSDGATRLVDRFGLLDWPSFLNVLAEQGPDAIIQQVRAAEYSDPDAQRWPRGKRHDDASAAFCQLVTST